MSAMNAMKRMLSGSVMGALFLMGGVAQAQTTLEWMTLRGESHVIASVVIRPSDNVVIRPSDNRTESVVIRPGDNHHKPPVVIRPGDNRTSSVVIRPGDNHPKIPVVIRPSDNLTASLKVSGSSVESVVIRPSDNRQHRDRTVVIRPSDNLTGGGWLVVSTGEKGMFSAVVDAANLNQTVKIDGRSSLQAEAALSLVDNGMAPSQVDLDIVADALRDVSFSADSMAKIHEAANLAVDAFLNGSCGDSDNLAARLCDALQ